MTFLRGDGALVAIGALTAALLAILGLSPTGAPVTDVVVLLIGCIAAVWCASWAPWWAIAALAGLGAVLADSWTTLLLGAAVFCAAAVLGGSRDERRWIWALLVGASIVVLATAREIDRFGVSSLVAIVAVAIVAGLGVARRPTRRRATLIASGAIGVLAVLAIGGAAYAANDARGGLSDGNAVARLGLRQLKSGEFEAARASFADATSAFDEAGAALDAPVARPALLMPIASQHLAAGTELAEAAEQATRTIETQLGVIDLDSLAIVDGRIDVEAVSDLVEPMTELQGAIDSLDQALRDADSGWLIEPVQRRLADLRDEVDEQRELGDKALAALEVAPAMLGADDERVYFVMFTTPAEARGQGGFMGNWAEIAIDDGRITMTDFGRDDVLNDGGDRPLVLDEMPGGWRARYGQFGFTNGPGGGVNVEPWKNITMSPDFPATSQVVAELYPKSGGQDIDGVVSLDVYALEELIGLVGPIQVEGVPEPLTGENTAPFLLLGQYLEFSDGQTEVQEARTDMLEAVTRETVNRMLFESPPAPVELGKAMAPLADERRVMAWAAKPDEQAVISSAGLDGAVRRDDGDLVAVTLNNAGGGKIDTFLAQEVEVVDGDAGPQLLVHLTNGAPADGLPPYLIGSLVGLPDGYSKLWVTGYASVPIVAVRDDGKTLENESSVEAGLHTLSAMVTLEPGESSTVTFDLDTGDKSASDFPILHQPLMREPSSVPD